MGLRAVIEQLLVCNSTHEMLAALWKVGEQDKMRTLILMWEWLSVRNKTNVGEAFSNPQLVFHWVEKLAVDFSYLKAHDKPPKPPDRHKWMRPPEEYVKVNFDGAFQRTTNGSGWGYVICDQAGEFVAAGAGNLCTFRMHFILKLSLV